MYFLNLIWRGIISGMINRQCANATTVFNGQCNFAYKLSPWIRKSVRQVELIHSFNSFSYIRTPFLPFITATVMISKQRITDHLVYYRKIKVPGEFDKKIHYISNAAPLPDTVLAKPTSPFTVLYVGRGGLEKRVPLVMEIAETVHSRQQDIVFEILGDVSDVVEQGKYPFVIFHGNQGDPGYIADVYSRAHVLILTSLTEGFPMVVIEAMGYGCAILATPVGDLPAHIAPGVNGFLFSSITNTTTIREEAVGTILKLFSNRELTNKLSSNNISYAKANFSLEHFTNAYRQVIKNET